MVTKSPKRRIVERRRLKKTNPRVFLERLDENVIRESRNRVAVTSRNASTSVKKEKSCLFSSEIDLNENECSLYGEQNCSCMCNYCSPLYELKSRNLCLGYESDQENLNRFSYLRDLVQENVYAPTAPQTRDTSTQTAPRLYKYTCKDCLSQFNDGYYFEQHLLVHRRLYECPYCNACFVGQKPLQSHVLLHLCKNVFECSYCNCAFPSRNLLIKHVGCHDKTFFECGHCKAKFHTDKELQLHKKCHGSTGKMIHVFRVAANDASTAEPQLQVRETETANAFQLERRSVAPLFYRCEMCNLRFANERSLSRHNAIHTRNAAHYLHVCTVCKARFRTNGHLSGHLRNAHKL